MPKKTLKSLVGDYIRSTPNSENIATRAIARAVVEKYPAMLLDIDSVRSVVRHVRGNNGDKARKYATIPRENGIAGQYKRELPGSLAGTREPYYLCNGRWLVLADMHVPYHDVGAIRAAVSCAIDFGCDSVLINGDFLDCHRISNFVPDSDAVSMAEELRIGRQMLEYLRSVFPDGRIVYKTGNHEERLETYMAKRAPDIADLDCWKLDRLLGLEDLEIDFVTDKRRILAGGLLIMHGHEFSKGFTPPISPARAAYMKASCNILVGHHHKSTEYHDVTANGDVICAWSTGCLCDLSPGYAPYGKMEHGFAIVALNGSDWSVYNARVIDGDIVQ